MKKNLLLFYLLSIGLPLSGLHAQHRRYVDKDERWEYSAWTGATMYSGDLDKYDVLPNFITPGFGIGASAKYYMIPRFGFRGGVDFATLWADDKLTGNHYKLKRDFSFHSDVFDIFFTPEYTFWHSPVRKWRDDYAYVYAGLGLFAFNTNLYKKGQFISNSSGLQANFPIGVGFKYSLDYQWSIGIDMRINRTTTDGLDAVSANRYIRSESGDFVPYGNSSNSAKKNSDWYYFSGITLTYVPRRFRVLDF